MKPLLTSLAIVSLVAVAACNQAEQAPPANEQAAAPQAQAAENVAAGAPVGTDLAAVMKARHEHYEKMGKAMKGLSGELKGASPSIPKIQEHAALIAGYGPQVLTWFPEGSGPDAGLGKTRAKAEIWSDAATFRQRAEQFQTASANFNQAAQSGDLTAIKAQMGPLGGSCKNCHDRFRAEED